MCSIAKGLTKVFGLPHLAHEKNFNWFPLNSPLNIFFLGKLPVKLNSLSLNTHNGGAAVGRLRIGI